MAGKPPQEDDHQDPTEVRRKEQREEQERAGAHAPADPEPDHGAGGDPLIEGP